MKKTLKYYSICLLFSIVITTCTGQKNIAPEYVGTWKTEEVKVTVRTEPERRDFKFTSGRAIFELVIKDNNTADGRIGTAEFKNAKIKKNPGNPEKKGLAYIIKCGSVGKIFENDPLSNKEVEIWLAPIKGNIDAELRYAQSGSKFPMAGMVFSKNQLP